MGLFLARCLCRDRSYKRLRDAIRLSLIEKESIGQFMSHSVSLFSFAALYVRHVQICDLEV
jgi:hypothetical protein